MSHWHGSHFHTSHWATGHWFTSDVIVAGFSVHRADNGQLLAFTTAYELDLEGLLDPGRWILEIRRRDHYGSLSLPVLVEVVVDDGGEMEEQFVLPRGVTASVLAGGMVELSWHVEPEDGFSVLPVEFEVAESEHLDDVLEVVLYEAGRRRYALTVGPFGDGVTVRLFVRSSDGVSVFGPWVAGDAAVASSLGPAPPEVWV